MVKLAKTQHHNMQHNKTMAIYTDNSNPIQHIESYPRGSNQTSNVLICYGSRLPNEISTVHPMTWALWACKHDHTYANLFQFELLRVKTLNKVVLRITINNFCPLEAKSKYSQMFRVVLFEKVSHNQYNSSASNHTTNQYPSSSQQTTHTTIGDTPKGPTPNGYSSTIQSESHRPSPPATPPQSQPNAMPSARSVHNAEDYQEEKERILKKEITEPKLPRFEFDHFDTFILDIDELSLSDPDSFCSPPPLPMTVIRPRINPLNNQNASNPPSQAFPPVNDDPVPPPSSKPEQKANIDPQRKNKKAERADEPVLARIFGDTDAHQGYQKYHKEARIKYAEQLKAAPKIEKNPKNYFLLLILPDWKHTIGNKIGLRDYGFHSDAGLNSKNGSKGRDSNKYHGVDFEVKGKDDDKPNKQPKQATSIILEVMQAKQFIPNQDYRYAPQGNGPQGFGCAFVFKGQSVAQGYGKNKSEAKRKCSRNAVSYFKGDPELSGCINRIELRIKPGKKDAPPVGYEYPVKLYQGRHGTRYQYQMKKCDAQQPALLQRSYGSESGSYYELVMYEDRGLFGDESRDNPSVEEMYIEHWETTFKGNKRNIPVHCHPYLSRDGRFIKRFTSRREKEIWKAIWKVYEQRKKDNEERKEELYNDQNMYNQKKKPHDRSYQNDRNREPLRSAQHEPEISIPLAVYNTDDSDDSAFEEVEVKEDDAAFTHCLMYDFDGTVYGKRLRHEWTKQNKPETAMSEYINDLIANDKVTSGFGGLERIQALKEHFLTILNQEHLLVAMHTFHAKELLQPLFCAIDVDMDEWFHIIVDANHDIQKKLIADKHIHGRYCKDTMVSRFCDTNKIVAENTLYIDDDRAIMQKVVCCTVFQVEHRGKGLTPEEMKQIVTQVQQKWYPQVNEEKKENSSYKDHVKVDPDINVNAKEEPVQPKRNVKLDPSEFERHSAVQMVNCITCGNSFNINKFDDDLPICPDCRNADTCAHWNQFQHRPRQSH
eukprot:1129513_1